MQPIIAILSPLRCEVEALTRAMASCKSNKVRPQPGHEINSV